mgnify:CR=1 FL=1
MRYFIELSYDGAAYCGWQRQPDAPTVQQALEKGLSTLLRQDIEVVGAGRTDTGVNASYYVAHFDTDVEVDCSQLLYKLNMMLPKDIAIFSVTPVSDDAHARFDARQREYRYYICPTKNPFRRYSAWLYYVTLDVEKMNCAAAKLLEYDDFTSFAKLNSNNKTNICRVMDAHWSVEADGVLVFTIRADRFLRNMVRAIVGTLIEVGKGAITVDEFRNIIESKDRCAAGMSVPAIFVEVYFDCSAEYIPTTLSLCLSAKVRS